MSRIDELQRLHEAATSGPWAAKDRGGYWRVASTKETMFGCDAVFDDGSAGGEYGDVCSVADRDHIVAMHNSWPAIHRVLLAARDVAGNTADDIDSRLRYVEVRPGRDEWNELVEALRAMDGDKGAT